MIAVTSLLVVVLISIVITRIAAIALKHTGLSRETARFQARSALSGAGFTTTESERVVNHPVRRRIILLLMLIGNVGIVGAVSSLLLTFLNAADTQAMGLRVVLLITGLVLLWAVSTSDWVDQRLSRLIDWALHRYTRLEVRDYASIMHLAGEYRIVQLNIEAGDWLAEKTLGETRLWDEGIVVLGITRPDGTYLGVPNGSTRILPEDTLIAYGRVSGLAALDQRRADWQGQQEHEAARDAQHQAVTRQDEKDPAQSNA